MSIGEIGTESLSEKEREALQIACEILVDHVFIDQEHLNTPKDIDNTMIGMYLPRRYLHRYTPLFLKQFGVCLIIVSWKLFRVESFRLASLAEELALWVIVQDAQRRLQDELEDVQNDDTLDTFIDLAFEDLDFQYLYSGEYNGIDQTEVGEKLGMTSLAFDDWFKPFSDEPDRIVHPYVS